MVSIGDKFNAFGAAVQDKAFAARNAAAEAGRFTGSLFVNQNTQQRVEQGFRDKVNNAYATVSGLANRGVEKMENEGVQTLQAPIRAMSELNISRLAITEDMSSNSKALRNGANKLINYHEKVIKASESVSRSAGEKTHSLVRLAFTPIRFVAKILQIEAAGALIQNAVALAAGFIVRGLVMTIMQIGHVLPYAAAAAVVGGVGVGLAALAVKVSPLAAFGVGLALILMAQQAQIITLGKKVDNLSNALRHQANELSNALGSISQQAAQQAQPSAIKVALLSAMNTVAKNKGRIIAGVAAGALALATYHYGPDAARAVASTDAYKATTAAVSSAYQTVASRITDLLGTGVEVAARPDFTYIASKADSVGMCLAN